MEWEILAPLIPAAKQGGHPRTTDMRAVCNAIYYYLKTGCQWNMLPADFPPISTVYSYYRKWQRKVVWEKLNHTLRGQVRSKLGRSTQPSALAELAVGIAADSQSVKTAQKRGMFTALMVASLPNFSIVCPDNQLGSNTPGTDDISLEQSAALVNPGSGIKAETEQSVIASLLSHSKQNLMLHEARNPTPIWKKEHWQDGSSRWVSIAACEQLGQNCS